MLRYLLPLLMLSSTATADETIRLRCDSGGLGPNELIYSEYVVDLDAGEILVVDTIRGRRGSSLFKIEQVTDAEIIGAYDVDPDLLVRLDRYALTAQHLLRNVESGPVNNCTIQKRQF